MTIRGIELVNDLLPEAKAAFLPLLEEIAEMFPKARITCGFRSQAEQDKLYAQGRTAPGPIVTWTQKSTHTKRVALDIYLGTWDINVYRNTWKQLRPKYPNIRFMLLEVGKDGPHLEFRTHIVEEPNEPKSVPPAKQAVSRQGETSGYEKRIQEMEINQWLREQSGPKSKGNSGKRRR